MTAPICSILVPALVVAAGLLATASASQATASAPAPVASATQPAASGAEQPVESPAYTYDPQGRRDPFVSLLRRGADTDRKGTARVSGLAGLEAAEVVLKGTMQSRTGYVALVEATDRKTYIVKAGDKLLDGTVRTITADAMIIRQQVNDPLSLEKEREVRKILRQTDEVK